MISVVLFTNLLFSPKSSFFSPGHVFNAKVLLFKHKLRAWSFWSPKSPISRGRGEQNSTLGDHGKLYLTISRSVTPVSSFPEAPL